MPVYRGTEVIEETLRSILDQTHTAFHLVMSVDGADDPTVEICRKYTDDPRIDLVVQENRLGWPGNFNRLVEACDREFLCYWQQDDLASTGYLESLRRELLAWPDAQLPIPMFNGSAQDSIEMERQPLKGTPCPV